MKWKLVKSRSVVFLFAFTALCSFVPSQAQNDARVNLNQIRDLIAQEKWAQAKTVIQSIKRDSLPSDQIYLFDFQNALVEFRLRNFEKSKDLFAAFVTTHTPLKDFARFYQAQSMKELGQESEALKILAELEKNVSNIRLRTYILRDLGYDDLKRKDFAQAQKKFSEILRRIRLSEDSPEIHYALAMAEKGLKNQSRFCQQIMKIYSEYPQYEKIKSWGPSLSENIFESEPTKCTADFDDFRRRIRFLMWAGLDQRAFSEIQTAKEKSIYVPVEVDQALAYYHVQSGEVAKALEVLKKYENELGNRLGYIVNYAGILARAGELSKSIQFYEKAHELDPKDSSGRQALYQAAFLSYQNRDYAMAEKKFKDFLRKYPRSGLTQDAKWHLAWIKYLKKEYTLAIEEFKNLETKVVKKRGRKASKRVVIRQDRVKYWLAMSYLRLEKLSQAKEIFANLAKDPLLGYYSIAAQARLKQIEDVSKKDQQTRKLAQMTTRPARPMFRAYLLPSIDSPEPNFTEESEEQLRFANDMNFSTEPSANEEDEVSRLVIQEENESDLEAIEPEEPDFQVKDPKIVNQLNSAKDLLHLGLRDFAKWDLYEVERSTRNRSYLRVLMEDYATLGQFHRSSFLAQTHFGSVRQKLGIDAGRSVWEQAFPKAYEEHVVKYSRRHGVSQELIWGIMKAESQFRMDAISPVGALGLMQVMPFTGMRLSALMKENEFQPSDLLTPDPAIRYGSRYLRRLADKFNGLTPLVAAAYNAGPHRVKSWTYSFGDLNTDEFIEHIPFLETRNYVKKVLAYHYVYSRLYKGSSDFVNYLSSNIPYQVDGKPPFRESWEDI